MKKNCICGLLVTLLAIPTFAQEVQQDSTIAAQVEAAFDAAAANAAMMDSAIVANTDSAALEEVLAPAKQKRERKERVYPVDSVHYTTGHVLSVGFGFGMSGLWSNGDNIKNSIGFPGFNASLRYTYYFFDWMGFTTGLDFSTYRAEASLEGVMDLEPNITNHDVGYIHRLDFNGKSSWKEMQDIKMLEVPIALSFRVKPHHVGFLGTVGLKLAFPVYGSYNYKGTLDHLAVLPESAYGKDAITPLYTEQIDQNETVEIKHSAMNVVNCNIFGEVGVLFQVHPRVDLSVSLYGNYGLNDLNSTKHSDRAAYAFGPAADEYRKQIPFNAGTYQDHNGLGGAAITDRVKPWNFGIKVAAHINVNKKSDEQKALENYVAPEVVHDTVIVTDTLVQIEKQIVHDTVIIKETEQKVEQITKMLEKVVIYYNSGDYKKPIIKPSNLLDSVAAIIAENPQIRVAVEGHASSDGNAAYNKKLSQNRANSVAAVLRKKGVRDFQMEVAGYGSEHPLKFGAADDPTKDRRVEIIPIQNKY